MPTHQRRQPEDNDGEQLDSFTIKTFCRRHQISEQLFYKLQRQGKAPQTMLVGTKVLISAEAAARWRREREAAAIAARVAAS